MKTKLPKAINSVDEAKAFLTDLHNNNEAYHPEENAHEILWDGVHASEAECDKLNKLMDDIYSLPELDNYPNVEWDPCGFLLDLNKNNKNHE